jgi:hypothetical protein
MIIWLGVADLAVERDRPDPPQDRLGDLSWVDLVVALRDAALDLSEMVRAAGHVGSDSVGL